MARSSDYSLLLLAGGRSKRMGRAKAELTLEGKTFLELMLAKAQALGLEQFYISGYPAPFPGVKTVPDQLPDRGPLGGLHACMLEMDTPYCLVLPVDAPTLPQSILEALLTRHESSPSRERVLIWEHGDRKEPLIAVYPVAMAQTIAALIHDRSVPVFRALDRWGYDCFRLELENDQILNVNTPELYEKIQRQNNGG